MKTNIGSITTRHTCSKCKGKKAVSFLNKIIPLEDLSCLVAYYGTCNTCSGQLDLECAEFRYTGNKEA